MRQFARAVSLGLGLLSTGLAPAQGPPPPATAPVTYRIEKLPGGSQDPRRHFTEPQLALIEKLNRRDRKHLARLESFVIPERWDLDELAYSPLPAQYPWGAQYPKLLVVHQPAQVIGAYESGRLVRWGPVSTGRRADQTPPGFFHLNWRSPGRHSTVNPEWFMEWYFNFHNQRGLSLHAYELPGRPESHACVRLLERDARWLFDWGVEWHLAADRRTVVTSGTPVLIVGRYAFDAPPPWRAPESHGVIIELPATPLPQ